MLSVQLRRETLIYLLCLLGLTTLTGCTSKPDRFGIIFISDNGLVGAADIYRMPDNAQTKIEQLTFTPTIGEYQLLVSKNGDRIIFEAGPTSLAEEPSDSTIEERQHIYLLNTASKKLEDMTNVFSVPPIQTPMQVADWSPDQKQFAVITYEGGLELMDFDGTNKKDIPVPTVGENPTAIKGIKWSQDGKMFALTRVVVGLDQQLQNPGEELLIFDLRSGKLKQIANYQENCLLPIWSPTNRQIVSTCILSNAELGGPKTIRIFNIENPGQPYERLVLSPCQYPSWSPDGKQIVFSCKKRTDQTGLFIINSDGNGIHEVMLGNSGNFAVLKDPTWSPDGKQIIYVAGSDSGHTNIFSVNPDGSNNHPLTNQEASYNIISVYPLP
jgi:Tol biopolymer transport system component